MTMKRIRLELARDHEFPNGSKDRGYEFAAPLAVTTATSLPKSGATPLSDAASRDLGQDRRMKLADLCIVEGGHGRLITIPRAVKMMSQASSSIVTTLSRVSTSR